MSENAPRLPRSETGLTVLYSGSFNPLHIGHLAILRALAARPDVRNVLLAVSPKNPLKENISESTAEARLQAAREALERHPELSGKVEACDIELRLGPPCYTIRTLDALASERSSGTTPDGTGLRLAIGADQLADFRRWKDYARILTEYGLLVYPREGHDSAALRDGLLAEAPAYRIVLLDAPPVNISSTALREGLVSDPQSFLM